MKIVQTKWETNMFEDKSGPFFNFESGRTRGNSVIHSVVDQMTNNDS